jgi:uncharacterized protein YjeT (DUF2065 family)
LIFANEKVFDMTKIFSWIALACLVILFGVVVFYTPAATKDEVENLNVSESDGKLHIEGTMVDGYMYRGYKLDSLAGNYFLIIKRGLVGNKSFDFEFDENNSKSKTAQPLERLYIMDSEGNKTLVYGEE